MRRITLWVLSTLSALVLLFGYHTSTSGPQVTSNPTSIYSNGTSATRGSSGPQSGSGSGSGSTGGSAAAPDPGATSATRTVTGSVAQTRWGPVQVQLQVNDGTITDVSVVQYPNGNPMDEEINRQALPALTQETLDAQGAGIDMISGATVTSDGYLESLQSALDRAGL